MKILAILFLFLFSNVSLFAQYPFGDTINDGLTAETAYQLRSLEHLEELRDPLGFRAMYNAA